MSMQLILAEGSLAAFRPPSRQVGWAAGGFAMRNRLFPVVWHQGILAKLFSARAERLLSGVAFGEKQSVGRADADKHSGLPFVRLLRCQAGSLWHGRLAYRLRELCIVQRVVVADLCRGCLKG